MTVSLVGAGPGDPGLLTLRGAELIGRAEVVVYDRLIAHQLLDLAPDGAELIDVGKVPHSRADSADAAARTDLAAGSDVRAGTVTRSDSAGRQAEINRLLVDLGRAGRRVVRLKGGDPFVFGRGGEEAEALARAGVDFEIVPGVSSAFAGPAAAGIPVTHRGLATSVTVVTARVGESSPEGVDWSALGQVGGTLVILMGVSERKAITEGLLAGGRPADEPVAVVHWGTTPDQKVVRSTLSGLPGIELPSPAVIVVGPVAGLDLGPLRPDPSSP